MGAQADVAACARPADSAPCAPSRRSLRGRTRSGRLPTPRLGDRPGAVHVILQKGPHGIAQGPVLSLRPLLRFLIQGGADAKLHPRRGSGTEGGPSRPSRPQGAGVVASLGLSGERVEQVIGYRLTLRRPHSVVQNSSRIVANPNLRRGIPWALFMISCLPMRISCLKAPRSVWTRLSAFLISALPASSDLRSVRRAQPPQQPSTHRVMSGAAEYLPGVAETSLATAEPCPGLRRMNRART